MTQASSEPDAGPGAQAGLDAPPPSPGLVLACIGLSFLLFVGTLGIGYLIWSAVTWGSGQTPAQRVLGLRCVHETTGMVAGRKTMAGRQVFGWCLNGQLLAGLFLVFTGTGQTSVGDVFLVTTVIRDQKAAAPAAGARH